MTNAYATDAELKAWLGITGAAEDSKITDALNAASRSIDLYCSRRFWVDTSNTDYYFTAEWPDRLDLPDFSSINTLKTDDNNDRTYETTWASNDYDTEPQGGVLSGITGWPITALVVRSDSASGQRTFPTSRLGVQVNGKQGWAAVPEAVKEGCLIVAARLFKRKDAPFGSFGTISGLGGVEAELRVPRLDPDERRLLAPYVRAQVYAV